MDQPRRWRRVDGVLLLDKPVGLSSNAALQRARRLLRAEKAGHTGTLDPLASGLLPLCFGEATKFAQALLDAPKRYRATIRFGAATDTGDAEGEVIARGAGVDDASPLRDALLRFVGPQMQLPPRHAALKHQGRAYYDYARAGEEVPRTPRPIVIHALDLVALDAGLAVVDVACSKGTYVRVLAEDLGIALGTFAHLAGLRRTGTGGFDLRDAVTLTALEADDEESRLRCLLAPDVLIAELPRLDLDAAQARAVRHGRAIAAAEDAQPERVRAYDPQGELVGLLLREDGCWRAQRLMRTD